MSSPALREVFSGCVALHRVMTTSRTVLDSREPSPGWLALVAVVLVQAGGLILSTVRDGTSVGTWLFLVHRWPEASSILFERTMMVLVLGASVLAAFGPSRWAKSLGGALASAWFAALAVGEWRMGGAPFTDFALLAHAARIVAPLLLVFWERRTTVQWILRVSIAFTFAMHGIEALKLHPEFIDYVLIADLRIFHLGLEQSHAELLLRLIGSVDLLIAGIVLTGRDLRPVLLWAAVWGVITAFSRIVQGGEGAMHHTLIRAANGGLPFVLFLLSSEGKMKTSFQLSRRLARTALPVFLLLLPVMAGAQAISGSSPGHLRVIWTEDPAHQATISWSTSSAGSSNQVYFDTQPRNGSLAGYAQKVSATGSDSWSGANTHHAELTGLTPSTTYYFVVVTDGQASPERHFISAPVDDRDFRLLSGGDSRTGLSDRKKMNQRIAALAEEDPGIIGFIHGGDYNDNDSASEWNGWLADHALTFTSSGRVLPIIPVRGNHEGSGSMYNKVFGDPGGSGKDYFVTRIGATTIINLDSNSSAGGDQKTWLEQQLKEAQSGRWIIPGYHRPAYPAVKTPGSAKQFWVPLFEKYNADVVLESDGHVLKRTVPIRNDKQDANGVVYVGEGGLGVPQRSPISAWYLKSPGMAKASHHVQLFSFTPQELKYEALTMSGSVEDEYTFSPKRTPGQLPTEPPVVPGEPPTEPTEPPTEPTEPPTEPTEPPTEPTEPPTEPTEPPTEPTEPPTEPTEPPVVPGEPPTQPTEPPTQPPLLPTEPPRPEPLPPTMPMDPNLPADPSLPGIAKPPGVEVVAAHSGTTVEVTFSEAMETGSAMEAGAYDISGAVKVLDVVQQSPRTFLLLTTPIIADTDYTLTVRNVTTAEGKPMEKSSMIFRAPADVTPAPNFPEPETGEGQPLEGGEERGPLGCNSTGGAVAWAGAALVGVASLLRRRRWART